MSNAKNLLLLLSTILVGTAVLHTLTDWFPLMVLSLAVCPVLLYLSFGFCDRCREYGSDCTCSHNKPRLSAHFYSALKSSGASPNFLST
jgi:hypothetical protein